MEDPHEWTADALTRRRSDVIGHGCDACLTGTVGATEKRAFGLDAVPDDLAAAVIANGREFVDRALEAVENVARPGRHDLEGKVIIVAADFTDGHDPLVVWGGGLSTAAARAYPGMRL
jgi:hypothetical protein